MTEPINEDYAGVAAATMEAALSLVELLADADTADDASVDERAARVFDCLVQRDRAQSSLEQSAHPDIVDAVRVWDDTVRPLCHRLVRFNEVREAYVTRDDFGSDSFGWWWVRGLNLPSDVPRWVGDVAAYIATFPLVSAEMASLAEAESRLRTPSVRAEASDNVRSLAAFIAAQRHNAPLRMAAEGVAPRTPLLNGQTFEISLLDRKSIVVDVLAELAPDHRPLLLLAGGEHRISTEVEGTVGRFEFILDERVLRMLKVVLVLPLATGTQRIVLPPG